jgi:hypothetical protein
MPRLNKKHHRRDAINRVSYALSQPYRRSLPRLNKKHHRRDAMHRVSRISNNNPYRRSLLRLNKEKKYEYHTRTI